MLCAVSSTFIALYCASLVMLPWSWFPPFPWIHEHAQWSDAMLALAAAAWVFDRACTGDWPKPRPVHGAMGLYLAWAIVSHIAAGLEPRAGAYKLLGMIELLALAVITEDVASRPKGLALIGRAMAWTCLATGFAALVGMAMWAAGIETPLVSHVGDLDPGPYARATAGLALPNLLASFAIFAAAAVAHPEAGVSPWLRRLALGAISVAALLSLSRGILGLILATLVRSANAPSRRRVAGAWAAASAAAILALTYWNVGIDPLRPWEAHLRAEPSSRRAAVTTSAATFARTPLFGVGPGNLPGSRRGRPCDAHLTPLNVAASLGAPALAAFAAIPILLWRGRRQPTDLATWGALAGLGLDALGQDVEDFRHVWVAFGLAGRRERALPD